ncbi:hypothetical protein NSS64_17190 [Paenibacillus sp. FSL H8-0122]|uniref:hypothetical protein n=1 Tax=Paenibacillus sp. FSL H8-0122 TaxID=2954510 RepID=UPI0030FA0276
MSILRIQKTSKVLSVCLQLLCNMLLLATLAMIAAMVWLAVLSGDGIPTALHNMTHIFVNKDHGDYAKSDLIIKFSGDVARLCLIIFVLFLVRMIFKDISRDYTPFVAKHTKRLKLISLLMAGIAFIPGLVEVVLIQIIDPVTFVYASFELFFVLVAIVFFCLAQIFEYGRMLQQQSDETL